MKVYAEGGGHDALNRALREGFAVFLGRALGQRRPRLVMCGSREQAWSRFRSSEPGSVLLVDAEAPVAADDLAWAHLQAREGWIRPTWATDDHAHLMVQCMEAWFLADPNAIEARFGRDFKADQLPSPAAIETIPKLEVYRGLVAATRATRSGPYDKGRDSGELLRRIDPRKVQSASPHAARFLLALRRMLPAG